jgi:hypothetical protein
LSHALRGPRYRVSEFFRWGKRSADGVKPSSNDVLAGRDAVPGDTVDLGARQEPEEPLRCETEVAPVWISAANAWSLAALHSRKARQANHAGTRRRLRQAAHMWSRIATWQWEHPDDPKTLEPPWPVEKAIGLLTGKSLRPHV